MTTPNSPKERPVVIGLHAADVDERFVRGTGPGGQKINKASSTVWLRHRPTGLEVRCQQERSQAANRELAWLELARKLAAYAKAASSATIAAREAERRRTRQKSRGQKIMMIEAKRHRSRIKHSRIGRFDE